MRRTREVAAPLAASFSPFADASIVLLHHGVGESAYKAWLERDGGKREKSDFTDLQDVGKEKASQRMPQEEMAASARGEEGAQLSRRERLDRLRLKPGSMSRSGTERPGVAKRVPESQRDACFTAACRDLPSDVMGMSSDWDIPDILSAMAKHSRDPIVIARGCMALAANERVDPASVLALRVIEQLVGAMQMHHSAQHHELQMWACTALDKACNRSADAIGRMLELGGIDLVMSAMDTYVERGSVQLAAGQLLLGLSSEKQGCDAIAVAGGEGRVKRAMGASNADPSLTNSVGPAVLRRIIVKADETQERGEDVSSLATITKTIYEAKEQGQEEAARKLRTMLSKEKDPPIQDVIDTGVVPRLIELLTKSQYPKLQFEAAWCLTNIVSGTTEHVKVCVNQGVVPKLIDLLDSPSKDVRDQAVWAIGNIAGDSVKFRDEVLNHNALMPLLRQLDPSTTHISMLRNATWTLSNLCRGKPQPPFELVKPALPTLATLIKDSNDEAVLTDACWALSYLSDGANEKIQAVIDAGVCGRLAELLTDPLKHPKAVTPALRGVGNIVTGDDQHTQAMIDCGVLPSLHKLLSHSQKGVRKETCWALSNITAGTKQQLQAVIDHGIIPVLVHVLETDDFDIRKECAWAISNATSGGDDVQIKWLVDNGCVSPLVNLLDKFQSDVRIVSVALEGIENILKSGQRNLNADGTNSFVAVVEKAQGVDRIKDLQRHENHKICDMAVKILENYFGK